MKKLLILLVSLFGSSVKEAPWIYMFTVEDENGNKWEYYRNRDPKAGQIHNVTFDDNGKVLTNEIIK